MGVIGAILFVIIGICGVIFFAFKAVLLFILILALYLFDTNPNLATIIFCVWVALCVFYFIGKKKA